MESSAPLHLQGKLHKPCLLLSSLLFLTQAEAATLLFFFSLPINLLCEIWCVCVGVGVCIEGG